MKRQCIIINNQLKSIYRVQALSRNLDKNICTMNPWHILSIPINKTKKVYMKIKQ